MLLVIGPVPFAAEAAWACSCADGGLADAELAFDGVVRSVQSRGGEERVKFAVGTVLKGAAGAEVTLTTWDNEASCGYQFDEGRRYRVYSVAGTTSLCSGNELLAGAPATEAGAPATGAGPGATGAEPAATGAGLAAPEAGEDQTGTDRAGVFWIALGMVALFVGFGVTMLVRYPRRLTGTGD
ncbi:hypothetical protein AB0F72_02850 [Actinoplanes sp. NPDC023936]|uniref:hypothetical protein n=1 Tax=Actinoplanes sp. NPDC023936 TaxID=3154910 RepID=UPI0033D455CB